MRVKPKLLIICVAIPLFVGILAAIITSGSMSVFDMVKKPPLSPPKWLFPIAWTVLYILMGVASYFVCVSGKGDAVISKCLKLYAFQLAVNFFWPIIFFSAQKYTAAFVWLCLLIVLVALCTINFWKTDVKAGALFVPYLVWTVFAGYLNLGIAILN